jgi:hypothetical protein
VVAVSSPEEIYPANFHFENIAEKDPLEIREQLDFTLKYMKGFRVQGGPRLLLHVQPLRYIAKLTDGSYSYVWEKTLWYFPVEMTIETLPVGNHVSLPLPLVLKDEFPIGEEVVCSLKAAYGAKGTVIGYGYDSHCPQGSAIVSNITQPICLPEDLVNGLHQVEPFVQSRELCRSLQVSNRVLSRLLGNLKLKYASSGGVGMYQLGFDLTNYKDALHVQGWARWSDLTNGYEYSRKVLPLLQEYKARFGKLWQRLEQLQGGKIARVEMLFPDQRNPLSELKRISLFTSKLPSARLPWTPDDSLRCGDIQLGILGQYMRSVRRSPSAERYHVNPALITSSSPCYIKPDYCEKVRFDLGCTVINQNSQDLPYVPFGALGIVVGLYPNDTVEVLFEGEQANTKVVRAWNLINVNYPFFVKLRNESAAGDVTEIRSEGPKRAQNPDKNTASRYIIRQNPPFKPVFHSQTDEMLQNHDSSQENSSQHLRTVSEAAPSKPQESAFKLDHTVPEFVPSSGEFTAPETAAFSSPFS